MDLFEDCSGFFVSEEVAMGEAHVVVSYLHVFLFYALIGAWSGFFFGGLWNWGRCGCWCFSLGVMLCCLVLFGVLCAFLYVWFLYGLGELNP